MAGVKPDYGEINTQSVDLRQSHDAGREAHRRTAMILRDLRGEPNRVSAGAGSNVAAKFGQTVLADSTAAQVSVMLPSATVDDIGRRVTIKVWCGTPVYQVLITALENGKIDGNSYWRLNQAMESVTIEYEGSNEWAIVASVSGVGGLVIGSILPLT